MFWLVLALIPALVKNAEREDLVNKADITGRYDSAEKASIDIKIYDGEN